MKKNPVYLPSKARRIHEIKQKYINKNIKTGITNCSSYKLFSYKLFSYILEKN